MVKPDGMPPWKTVTIKYSTHHIVLILKHKIMVKQPDKPQQQTID